LIRGGETETLTLGRIPPKVESRQSQRAQMDEVVHCFLPFLFVDE
jgi:hypothetical protein